MEQNEQPILGIVATINGNDITKGANDLVNNVGRIEKAADGASRSIINTYETLKLRLVEVNEKLSLATELYRKLESASNSGNEGNANKMAEAQKKINSLLLERQNILKDISSFESKTGGNEAVKKVQEYIEDLNAALSEIKETQKNKASEMSDASKDILSSLVSTFETALSKLDGIKDRMSNLDISSEELKELSEEAANYKDALDKALTDNAISLHKERLAQIREEMEGLASAGADASERIKELKEEESDLNAAIKSLSQAGEEQAKSSSRMAEAAEKYNSILKVLPSSVRSYFTKASGLVSKLGLSISASLAMIVGVVGAVILAIGKSIDAYSKSSVEAERRMIQLKSTWSDCMDDINNRLKQWGALFVSIFTEARENMTPLLHDMEKVSALSNSELKIARIDLKRKIADDEVSSARIDVINARLQRKADNTLYSEEDRAKASKQIADNILKVLGENVSNNQASLNLAQETYRRDPTGENEDKARKAQIEYERSVLELERKRTELSQNLVLQTEQWYRIMSNEQARASQASVLNATMSGLRSQAESPYMTNLGMAGNLQRQMSVEAQRYDLQLSNLRSRRDYLQKNWFALGEDQRKEKLSLDNQIKEIEASAEASIENYRSQIASTRKLALDEIRKYNDDILEEQRNLDNALQQADRTSSSIAIAALADSVEKRRKIRQSELEFAIEDADNKYSEAVSKARLNAISSFESNPYQKGRIWDDSLLSIEKGSKEYEGRSKEDRDLIDRYNEQIRLAKAVRDNEVETARQETLAINELLEKYQTYTIQRISLETEYQTERERISNAIAEQERILSDETAEQEQKNNAIVIKNRLLESQKALEQENKARQEALAGRRFQEETKNDRLYKMANGDLSGLNIETLRVLSERLKELNEIPNLNPSQIEQLQALIDDIDVKIVRSTPLKEYIDSEEKLQILREKELAISKAISMAKKNGSDKVQYTVGGASFSVSMKDAVDELYNICKGIQTQTTRSDDAANNIVGNLTKIFNSIQNIGEQIGGDAGAVVSAIGSIGNTWSSSYMSSKELETKAKNQEVGNSAAKAMAILQGVEAGISVGSSLTRLFESTGVSKQARYEKYAKKVNDANELTNSLYRYRIALAATTVAEKQWFGNDPIGNLRDKWEEGHAAMMGYYSKLKESQAIYQNKSKHEGDWLGNVIVGSVAGAIVGGLAGSEVPVYGNIIGAAIGGIVGGVAGATTSFAEQYFNGLSYKEGQTAAMDNLRIETRAKKSSFLWIGGHDQETADLRTWAKQTYGRDLFDKKGLIDADMAQEIIDTYGDKLQGQTQATLEQLIKLREKYDEYMDQLKEYVNSLYSPLTDSMTNAIWDWFDNGVDALHAFREEASGTFRNIANDLLQTIVMKKIFGSYEDEILELYDKMNTGAMSEETLFANVASKTSEVMTKYEQQIPYLEGVLTAMDNVSKQTLGIDISGGSSYSQSASYGLSASFSQDSIDEANGRMTALQMGQQYIIEGQQSILEQMMAQTIVFGAMATNIGAMRGDVSEIRDILYSTNELIYGIKQDTSFLRQMDRKLEQVVRNTDKL